MTKSLIQIKSKKIETRNFVNDEKQISITLEDKLWPALQLIADARAEERNWLSGISSNFDRLNIWIWEQLLKCPINIDPNTWIAEVALSHQNVNSVDDVLANMSDSELDKLFEELGNSKKTNAKVGVDGQIVIPRELEGLGIENLLEELDEALNAEKKRKS
jgi:hypothetical protein